MSDLSSKRAAQTVKLAGADRTSGSESAMSFVETRNGEIKSVDTLNIGGNQGPLMLPGTSATPIRVGATNVANRKMIMIYNNSTHTIYYGVTASVTVGSGIPLSPQSLITLSVSSDVTIYGITANNQTAELRIVEVA